MKFVKIISLIIAFQISCYSQHLFANTIHCIFAVDVQASTTKKSCQKDLENMCQHIKRMAKAYSSENPVFHKMTGDDFRADRLIRVLKNIKAKESDIIIFYYSGHGLWDSKKGLILSLKEKAKLPLSQIEKIIQEKEVKLKFIITDACKKQLKGKRGHGDGFSVPLYSDPKVDENYRELLAYEGFMRATSCQPGQESYGSQYGSYFTTAFLKSIAHYVETDLVSWEAIRMKTERETKDSAELKLCIQEPDIDTSELKKLPR